LLPQPLQVEILDIVPIDLDDARDWIVKPLDEADDCALAATASADERDGLTRFKVERKALEDRDVGAGRVVEYDILEADGAAQWVGLLALGTSRVNDGDSVDGLKQIGAGCLRLANRRHLVGNHAKRKRGNHDAAVSARYRRYSRKDDGNNIAGIAVSPRDEQTTKEEPGPVHAPNDPHCVNSALGTHSLMRGKPTPSIPDTLRPSFRPRFTSISKRWPSTRSLAKALTVRTEPRISSASEPALA
jgi:hypothetical protein